MSYHTVKYPLVGKNNNTTWKYLLLVSIFFFPGFYFFQLTEITQNKFHVDTTYIPAQAHFPCWFKVFYSKTSLHLMLTFF